MKGTTEIKDWVLLALLAYQFGSISKAELEWCLKKWKEKRSKEAEDD